MTAVGITFHHDNKVTIVTPEGGMLGETIMRDIIKEVEVFIAQGRVHLILDLKSIKLINSSGMGMLVTCLMKIRKKQGDMVLANMPEPIRRVFDIVKLSAMFTIVHSVDEGKAALKKKNGGKEVTG